jgi:hypothetical protein
MNNLDKIAAHFDLAGEIAEIKPFGSGHIHETFHIRTLPDTVDDYILQKINVHVFRDPDAVMQNLRIVTAHIRAKLEREPGVDLKRELLTPVWLKNGELMYTDPSNEVWRCFVYIPNHKSYDRAVHANQVYEGGRAFGKFLFYLSDLPVELIRVTIPDFHNLAWRLQQFSDSIKSGLPQRIRETDHEIKLLQVRTEEMLTIRKLSLEGKIPTRIVHHDTKINNVLYTTDDKALCVIDLDTVMAGNVHDDFGDAIRTFTNTGEEDDLNLDKVTMNIRYFEAFARGFLEVAGAMLNPVEKEYLALSARMITYMQSLRFLADYLNGDIYYKIHYPMQNLQRARAQIKLLLSMEEQYEEMKEIVKSIEG